MVNFFFSRGRQFSDTLMWNLDLWCYGLNMNVPYSSSVWTLGPHPVPLYRRLWSILDCGLTLSVSEWLGVGLEGCILFGIAQVFCFQRGENMNKPGHRLSVTWTELPQLMWLAISVYTMIENKLLLQYIVFARYFISKCQFQKVI